MCVNTTDINNLEYKLEARRQVELIHNLIPDPDPNPNPNHNLIPDPDPNPNPNLTTI